LALSETDRLILIVVLAVLMTFIVLFELKVMRSKSKEVRAAGQKRDEAFNSVLTTRSVLNAVRDRGGKVGEAPALLERAKEALARNKFDSCIDFCESARSELTNPSSAPARSKVEPGGDARDSLEVVAESIVSAGPARAESDSYKGTKLESPGEGNYLGAKFEMSAAKADIARAVRSGIDTSVADGLMVEAQTAFAAGRFDKALSLAVRSRKALSESAEDESISLREEEQGEQAPEPQVYEVKEEAAKAPSDRICRDCGAVLEKGDAFCPVCGTKARPKACPSCGAKPRKDDKFCRKCGSEIE